jgi:hypothetical protein
MMSLGVHPQLVDLDVKVESFQVVAAELIWKNWLYLMSLNDLISMKKQVLQVVHLISAPILSVSTLRMLWL